LGVILALSPDLQILPKHNERIGVAYKSENQKMQLPLFKGAVLISYLMLCICDTTASDSALVNEQKQLWSRVNISESSQSQLRPFGRDSPSQTILCENEVNFNSSYTFPSFRERPLFLIQPPLTPGDINLFFLCRILRGCGLFFSLIYDSIGFIISFVCLCFLLCTRFKNTRERRLIVYRRLTAVIVLTAYMLFSIGVFVLCNFAVVAISIVLLGCFTTLMHSLLILTSIASLPIEFCKKVRVLHYVNELNYCLIHSVLKTISGIYPFFRNFALKWITSGLVPVRWQGGKDRKKKENGNDWFDEDYVYWYNTLHTYCSNGTRYYIVHLNSSNGQLVKAEPSCHRRQAIINGVEARTRLYQAQTGGLTDSISVFLDTISNDANPWFVLQFIKEIICVVLLFHNFYKLKAPFSTYLLLIIKDFEKWFSLTGGAWRLVLRVLAQHVKLESGDFELIKTMTPDGWTDRDIEGWLGCKKVNKGKDKDYITRVSEIFGVSKATLYSSGTYAQEQKQEGGDRQNVSTNAIKQHQRYVTLCQETGVEPLLGYCSPFTDSDSESGFSSTGKSEGSQQNLTSSNPASNEKRAQLVSEIQRLVENSGSTLRQRKQESLDLIFRPVDDPLANIPRERVRPAYPDAPISVRYEALFDGISGSNGGRNFFADIAVIGAFMWATITLPSMTSCLDFPTVYNNIYERFCINPITQAGEIALLVIKSITYICTELMEVYRSGSWSRLFVSRIGLRERYAKVHQCGVNLYLYDTESNPDLPIPTIEAFEAEVGDLETELMTEVRMSTGAPKAEFEKMLNVIRHYRREMITTERLNKPRSTPFSCLIWGDSSIGKSSAVNLIFTMHGAIINAPTEARYKYLLNPDCKHWDQFRNYQWCVVVDDIARETPKMIDGTHNSTNCFLGLVNPTPLHPSMSNVEDKAVTAVKAKLVIGTTNNKELNATVTHACPVALLRRFEIFVGPVPRPECCTNNKMDANKTLDWMTQEFDFPHPDCRRMPVQGDQWLWTVERAVIDEPGHGRPQTKFHFEKLLDKVEFSVFQSFYVSYVDAFIAKEAKVRKANDDLGKTTKLCSTCRNFICRCVQAQAGEEVRAANIDILQNRRFVAAQLLKLDTREILPSLNNNNDNEVFNYIIDFCKYYRAKIVLSAEEYKEYYKNGGKIINSACAKISMPSKILTESEEDKKESNEEKEVETTFYQRLKEKMQDKQFWVDSTLDSITFVYEWFFEISYLLFFLCLINYFPIKIVFPIMAVCAWPLYRTYNHKIKPEFIKFFIFRCRNNLSNHWLAPYIKRLNGVIELNFLKQVLTVLAIATLVTAFITMICNKFETKTLVHGQGLTQSTEMPRDEEKKETWWTSFIGPSIPLSQQVSTAPSDTANADILKKKIKRNVAKVVLTFGERNRRTHCVILGSNLIAINRHTLYKDGALASTFQIFKWVEGAQPRFTPFSINVLNREVIYERDDNDLAFLFCADSLNAADLSEYFIDAYMSGPVTKFKYPLLDDQDVQAQYSVGIEHKGFPTAVDSIAQMNKGVGLDDITFNNHFRRDYREFVFEGNGSDLQHKGELYSCERPGYRSQSGDCGSPYVCSSSIGSYIVGLHMAGGTWRSTCLICPIFKRDVTAAKAIFKARFPPLFSVQAGEMRLDVEVYGSKLNQHSLRPLHKHSILRGTDVAVIEPLGTLDFKSPALHSHVFDHITRPFWARQGIVVDAVAPTFNRKPWKLALEEFSKMPKIDCQAFLICAQDYLETTLRKLDEKVPQWQNYLGVLDASEVVHGIDDMKYVDHLNFTTSAGFPWYQKKDKFIPLFDNQRSAPEWLYEKIRKMEKQASMNQRNYPVFTAHLKDMAITQAKKDANKVRVFVGSPMDFTILTRMYLLSFVRLMHTFRLLFEAAPAIVTQGPDWTELYKYLFDQPYLGVVGGDYKFYDKAMHQFLTRLAFWIVIQICVYSKRFSEIDIVIMRSIAEDIVNPVVDFNGDLMNLLISNPSGHPLTVVINCIVNSLYIRFSFLKRYGNLTDFARKVTLVTYGDDNLMTIRDCDFNHTHIQDALGEMGVLYTMPDKTSVSRPYLNMDEVEFLKRKFVPNAELSNLAGELIVLAPLEITSIHKMLCVGLKSKSMSAEAAASASLRSACDELILHGREFYSQFKILIDRCSAEHDLPYVNLTWEQGIARYFKKKGLFSNSVPTLQQFGFPTSYLSSDVQQELIGVSYQNGDENSGNALASSQSQPSANFLQYEDNNTIQRLVFGENDATFRNNDDLIGSIGSIFERDVKIASYSISENTNFSAVLYPWLEYVKTPIIQEKLSGFSKMRGKLKLTVILNASPFRYGSLALCYKPLVYAPQHLSDTPYVTSTGTPIWVEGDETRDYSGGRLNPVLYKNHQNAGQIESIRSQLLQRPNIMLYPQFNTKGEMTLPFVHYMEYLEMQDIFWDNTYNGTNRRLREMGKIDIFTPTLLRTSSEASVIPMTVDIYAHMEELELCGASMQLQADEYDAEKPISSSAKIMATAAGSLSSIPVVGPYAIATSFFLNTLGSIASWFGWTNTININKIEPVKTCKAIRWADTEAHVPIAKLALDPKNELSVDNSIVGFNRKDELIIEDLVAKPFWLGSTDWGASDAPNQVLFTTGVNPAFFHKDVYAKVTSDRAEMLPGVSDATIYTPSPAAWIANAFSQWRGTLVLNIKVMASKFHRGRLRLTYDPMGTSNNFEEGRIVTKIIDIQHENDFVFEVPFQSVYPTCHTIHPSGPPSDLSLDGLDQIFEFRGAPAAYLNHRDRFNGVVRLTVLNRLSGPMDAGVDIMVFASWKNMQFFEPRNIFNQNKGFVSTTPTFPFSMSYFEPVTVAYQSGDDELQGTTSTVEVTDQAWNKMPMVVNGETCLSIRQLLHRWNFHSILVRKGSYSTSDVFTRAEVYLKRFPSFHGRTDNSINKISTSPSIPYEFGGQTALNYFTPAFTMYRGGLMYRVQVDMHGASSSGNMYTASNEHYDVTINRHSGDVSFPEIIATEIVSTETANSMANKMNIVTSMSTSGMETSLSDQQLCEAVLPDYFSLRAHSANPNVLDAKYRAPHSPSREQENGMIIRYNQPHGVSPSGATATFDIIKLYTCGASDFNLIGFMNVPSIYIHTDLVTVV